MLEQDRNRGTGTEGSSGPFSPSPTPAQTTCESKHISRAARAPEFYYPSKQDRKNFSHPEAEADPAQKTQVCRIPARGGAQLLQQFPLKASLHRANSRNASTLSFYPPSASRDSYHHQTPCCHLARKGYQLRKLFLIRSGIQQAASQQHPRARWDKPLRFSWYSQSRALTPDCLGHLPVLHVGIQSFLEVLLELPHSQ